MAVRRRGRDRGEHRRGILAWQTRDTKRILARMDQTNRAYHEVSQGMLERMDRANEQRAEALRALLERR